jgi:hypothetical protein
MQYTTQTITTEKFTVTVHRPILSDSERKKREQEVITALAKFGKAIEREKTQ